MNNKVLLFTSGNYIQSPRKNHNGREIFKKNVTMHACLILSNSLQPHGLQPTSLLSSMGFSRQEHWSGLPFPSPGDLPNPGIELFVFCVSCIDRQVLYLLIHLGSSKRTYICVKLNHFSEQRFAPHCKSIMLQ